MLNVDEAISKSIELMKSTNYSMLRNFNEYSEVYLHTTENILGYMPLIKFGAEKALTVLGSGDQVFNLVSRDIFQIDAFDINKLTYFVFSLKKAMIQAFSLYKYQKNFEILEDYKIHPRSFSELLNYLKPLLTDEVYQYFKVLDEYNNILYKKNKANSLPNLFLTYGSFSLNLYTDTKYYYERTRRNLEKLKINFYFDDARKIPFKLDSKYDVILLSNISDYLSYELTLEEFNEYIESFLKHLSNEGILINYLYRLNREYAFIGSEITKRQLGLENIIEIENENKTVDGVYVKRLQKCDKHAKMV